jgi:hypothetical protein
VKLTYRQITNFWAGVAKPDHPDLCWEWQRGRDSRGYGYLRLNGKRVGSHRVAWALANDADIPAGLMIRHRVCGNPACNRPSHLAIGDHAANMADKVSHGRQARLRGEASGTAVLTDEIVAIIRWLVRVGRKLNQSALARRFEVTEGAIRHVITRRTWTHVPDVIPLVLPDWAQERAESLPLAA